MQAVDQSEQAAHKRPTGRGYVVVVEPSEPSLTELGISATVLPMTPGDQFGPVLRRVRTERGLTQEQLAEVSGLHRTEISLLERSQRKPLLETVVALCRGLGVTPAELLHEVKI